MVLRFWLTFLLIGSFLALTVPLGEGFDEAWHLAYIQYVAQNRTIPHTRTTRISREITDFIHAHPVAWGLHTSFPNLKSYEQYWNQPQMAREESDRQLAAMRFSGSYVEAGSELSTQYESIQPPLYYYLGAPLFLLSSKVSSFLTTFLVMRLWSVLLASLTVPAVFLLARELYDSRAFQQSVALLVVVFPGMYSGITRVCNDSLSLPIACFSSMLLLRSLKQPQSIYPYLLGLSLVAGLWARAFFIPIVAAMILALLFYRDFRTAGIVIGAFVLGFIWYLINFTRTGSFTGLSESLAVHPSIASSIQALFHLDWINLFNVGASSHIYIGNWSFLMVRSWMYLVVSRFFIIGLLGFARRPRTLLEKGVLPFVVIYCSYIAALIYYATQVFQLTGTSVIEGWYMTSLVPVEAVLFAEGAICWSSRYAKWMILTFICLLTPLLVYSAVFVASPYYAGITSHGAMTFHPHWSDFSLISSRLLRFYPWIPAFTPWLLLVAAVCMVGYSTWQLINDAKGNRAPGWM